MQKQIFRFLKRSNNLLLVTAGTAVLAFGMSVFIIPFDLVTGGVSGLAIVLAHLLPTAILTVEAWIAILTWSFFFMGLLVLGKTFAAKTLLSSLLYPPLVSMFLRLPDPQVLGGFFDLKSSAYPQLAPLIATALGGAVLGAGCALTFLGGGSTGGSDVLAFLLCKKHRHWRLSTVIFGIDAIIVLLGIAVLRDFILSCLGVLAALEGAFMIDKLLHDVDS